MEILTSNFAPWLRLTLFIGTDFVFSQDPFSSRAFQSPLEPRPLFAELDISAEFGPSSVYTRQWTSRFSVTVSEQRHQQTIRPRKKCKEANILGSEILEDILLL